MCTHEDRSGATNTSASTLESFVKTAGGKGLHVYVPLAPEHGWEALKEFSRAVALGLARDESSAFTATMAKSQRKGKVFVDYLRNVRGANAVGPYSTRAREGAFVAVPVDWDDRLRWYEAPGVQRGVIALCLLLFLSVLVASAARSLPQWRFRELRPLAGRARAARRLAIAVAALFIAFVPAFAAVASDFAALTRGEVAALKATLVLPVVGALLSLGLPWFAVVAWRRKLFGLWGRIHYTAVAAAALVFVWLLDYWNLLGWRL